MNFYGSQLWYNTKANSGKLVITMQTDAVESLVELLEKSDLNYYGYENEKIAKISINRDDLDLVKSLVGDTVAQAMHIEEIKKSYTPPEKNIFGTIDYKYISKKSKRYISGETEIVQKAVFRTAELLTRQGVKFSGRAYDNKVTLTLNEKDLEKATAIYNSVLSNLQERTESVKKFAHERRIDKVIASLEDVGFSSEYIQQLQENINIVSVLASFTDVDYYDYAYYLNPNYTNEQNSNILEKLGNVYANGGFEFLQPSQIESELYEELNEVQKEYDLDLRMKTDLQSTNILLTILI